MPHRVTNFLRTSSGGIPHMKKPSSRSGSGSRGNTPDASDSEEHYAPILGVKISDHSDKKHHLLSLPFGKHAKEHGGGGSSSPVTIGWSIESPPIVFHGRPQESTGALISGQLFLDVREDMVEVERFTAALNLHMTHRRPFQGNCQDCRNQYIELESWRFLSQATVLRRGRHQYPFSVLLGGDRPATLGTPILNIDYEFTAEAFVIPRPVPGPAVQVKFERPLVVKRSIPEPDLPHHSVRVFPPTNIKASAHYAPVIHPTGVNNVTFKLDGLMSLNQAAKSLDIWRLKKVSWRLEETIQSAAPACERHVPADAEGEEQKSVARSETRCLGEKHMHEGWKSDYGGTDGTVDLEFDYSVTQLKPYSKDFKYACDSKAADGTQVTHSLLVELVVSKEHAPEHRPQLSAPTGTGRVLRMHFAVVMTDHAGMGVSWDNESPPVYWDVPPSPPGYPCGECPVDYESLEPLDSRRSSVEPLDRNRG